MKAVFRNFLFVLKRFKIATLLNILGLSMAFAAFIVMMIQVRFEYRFDRCHPNAEQIFRVDLIKENTPNSILPRAFADAVIASSPHIKEGSIITPINKWMEDRYVAVGDGEQSNGFKVPFVTCYPNITHIFGFQFTEGDLNCLKDPEKAIIPRSMAQRMFGNESAIGKQLHLKEYIWTKGNKELTIGGVYKDFPGNTQIENVIYTQIDNSQTNDWMSQNYICYLLFDNKEEAAKFEVNFNKTFDFSPLGNNQKTSINLMPLTDIYFNQTGFRTGNLNTVRILFAIAWLVIIIAAINYMNFSVAMTPMRIRSLNTQKILGSSVSALRASLVSEAMMITFVSWGVALLWVFVLVEQNFLSFFGADLHLQKNLSLGAISGLIALLVGLAAGLYPAFYATSLQPALVLKGNYGLLPAGRKLRIILIGFQFIISISLIIAAIFIQKQNYYLQNFNQGFDKEHIAIVSLDDNMYHKNRDLYVNQLKAYPGIDDVAFSKQKLGASDGYTQYGFTYKEKVFGGYTLEVSDNFLSVMRIPIREGRDFLPSDTVGRSMAFILNNSLQQKIGVNAGETIGMTSWSMPLCMVAGITGEVKFTSLRKESDDILFLFGSNAALPVSYIRLNAGINLFEVVKHIRRTVADIDPTYPVEVEFYDQILNNLYQKEETLNKNILFLSILAISISIAGIFGLVMFETQYRRIEIGIRKVFGSSIEEILLHFNKTYLFILCVSFLLAVPVAYYAITRWLENFAYKTPVSWWGFALAGILVFIITVITVSIQSYKAATANPVDALKSE